VNLALLIPACLNDSLRVKWYGDSMTTAMQFDYTRGFYRQGTLSFMLVFDVQLLDVYAFACVGLPKHPRDPLKTGLHIMKQLLDREE
jgi:hypothetical protein